MKAKFTINKLVVKVPGENLPKEINMDLLDEHTKNALLKAYKDSVIYASNLTATKSEKLSAAMSKNIAEFRRILSDGNTSPASAFCMAFDFDSISTPNIVRIVQYLAVHPHNHINIETLLSILILEHGITLSAAEVYAEFQSWKYYEMIKACVGGVSVVKFMRFYIGLLNSVNS